MSGQVTHNHITSPRNHSNQWAGCSSTSFLLSGQKATDWLSKALSLSLCLRRFIGDWWVWVGLPGLYGAQSVCESPSTPPPSHPPPPPPPTPYPLWRHTGPSLQSFSLSLIINAHSILYCTVHHNMSRRAASPTPLLCSQNLCSTYS